MNKFSKCQFCHDHKHKSLEIFLDITLTYICIVHVSFVQCASSFIKKNYYLNSYPITVGSFVDSNATTVNKPKHTHILLLSQTTPSMCYIFVTDVTNYMHAHFASNVIHTLCVKLLYPSTLPKFITHLWIKIESACVLSILACFCTNLLSNYVYACKCQV